MGYWLKKFADGTEIRGTDRAVYMKAASWSKSRLDSMVETELSHHNKTMQLVGLGEYWQSDTYESVYPGRTSLIQRRIQRKIEPSDTHFRIQCGNTVFRIEFNDQRLTEGGVFRKVEKAWHGKWFVMEMNLKTGQWRYYVRSERI